MSLEESQQGLLVEWEVRSYMCGSTTPTVGEFYPGDSRFSSPHICGYNR